MTGHSVSIGHPVLNPEGREIRLPAYAMRQLRQLGCLFKPESQRYRKPGERLMQIHRRVYFFLTGGSRERLFLSNSRPGGVRAVDYKAASARRSPTNRVNLLSLLGPDCSGPNVVSCSCRQCSRSEEDHDRTPISRKQLNWS